MKKRVPATQCYLLDESTTMSTIRGDPSSALLEVLDQMRQPHSMIIISTFDYDLFYFENHVHLEATRSERIPRPLQDRMEIIRIAGTPSSKKLNIAKRYRVKKQREANGLAESNLEFTDSAL